MAYEAELGSTSLEYHQQLNPSIWEDYKLRGDIREKLKEIGYAWADFAAIPRGAVVDIVFTGSLANYNYTPYSDVDLHLYVDMDKMPIKDEELRQRNIFHLKALWAKTHPEINILGYPVELYAEDYKTRHPFTQGVYSILGDHWIQHAPFEEGFDYGHDVNHLAKVNHLGMRIDHAIDSDASLDDIKKLKNEIWTKRAASIQEHGELKGADNLIFKELRNRGVIDRLLQHEKQKLSKSLSITESVVSAMQRMGK